MSELAESEVRIILLYCTQSEGSHIMKEAAKSSTETERDHLDDEVDRRQRVANKAGQKSHMKTGGGQGKQAPDQIDPDDVTNGNEQL